MSEEEKKAIEYLKGKIEINNTKIKNIEDKGDKSLIGLGTMHDVYKLQNLNYIILLNLIEKQQKEIIEKCEKIDSLERDIGEYILEKEKQDKMIDLILASWKQDDVRSIEELKEYFRKRVEEDGR